MRRGVNGMKGSGLGLKNRCMMEDVKHIGAVEMIDIHSFLRLYKGT